MSVKPQSLTTESTLALNSQILFLALALGIVLRLIAVTWGDLDAGGDGTYRLIYAAEWARHPQWKGLTGVWPPLHWYFLGTLIRLWDEPVFWARFVNLICGVGAIFALRSATRSLFGVTAANISALLLAISWTHIWLTTGYWVEMPYLFFVFLATVYAMRARESGQPKDAFLSGLWLSLAVMLRHEGMLLVGLFFFWYLLNAKHWRLVFWFALAPAIASSWHFIEPWLNGHSYFEYSATYAEMKAGENITQGLTLKDRLFQIVLIPAAAPSLFVILPGLYGLWRARHLIRRDLFAWMFIAQALMFITLTFTVGWRPQLRYVLLYFVNLYPYTALMWQRMMEWRLPARVVLGLLVAATILAQSAAWWIGRNDRLAFGYLPLRIQYESQKVLDEWVRQTRLSSASSLKITAVATSSLKETWRLPNSLLTNHIFPSNPDETEFNAAYLPGLLEGRIPPSLQAADIILIDPRAFFYEKLFAGIKIQKPGVVAKQVHPEITAWLLTPQAQSATSK